MKDVRVVKEEKVIYCRKQFLIQAGQFGTEEFDTMEKMMEDFPGFKIEEFHIQKSSEKKSYGKLTYEVMRTFIECYAGTEALKEFEMVRKLSKAHKGAYAFVKSWFLKKYGKELDNREVA